MCAKTSVLGVDFGTSNSAVGIAIDGAPHLIEVDVGHQTLPTALFFDFETRRVVYGHGANAALIEGAHGRYMRGLKSLLGTALMRERRRLLQERLDFIEITGRFLAHLKARAEAATQRRFTHVVSGRPVVFHDAYPERDVQAEVDLRACYATAGFEGVRFLNEPEAAARAYGGALAAEQLGLVIDIGGGTSDVTLFRSGRPMTVVHSSGLRLGGTDFDRHVSMAHVMPALGKGSAIRHAFGQDTHLAPNAIFNDLATWAKIPFLYSAETRRAAAELARYAVEPDRLALLTEVMGEETGHDIAFAVEAGKIAANGDGAAAIDLSVVAPGLTMPLSAAALAQTLAADATAIADLASETVTRSGHSAAEVDGLILVGGSSLMRVVTEALAARFPGVALHRAAALTAVADGLALASGDPWPI